MRTRRKNVKTPGKGRRSSVIVVRKSPIARKNTKKANKNPNNKFSKLALAVYESPLDHFRFRGPAVSSIKTPPSTSSSEIHSDIKNDVKCNKFSSPLKLESKYNRNQSPVKSETKSNKNWELHKSQTKSNKNLHSVKTCNSKNEASVECEASCSTFLSPVKSEKPNKSEEDNEIQKMTNNKSLERNRVLTSPPDTVKRKFNQFDNKTGNTPNVKKRKIKKSPLSRINPANYNLSESSIIVIEDELLPNKSPPKNVNKCSIKESPPLKCVGTNSLSITSPKNTLQTSTSILEKNTPQKHTIQTKQDNDEVIVIDCDASVCENDVSPQKNDEKLSSQNNLADSVIVLDDELPEERNSPVSCSSKTNEDCFVVWSSSSTSNEPDNYIQSRPKNSFNPSQYSNTFNPSVVSSTFGPSQFVKPLPPSQISNKSQIPRTNSVLNTLLLKQDKILLDTRSEPKNFNLNTLHENIVPKTTKKNTTTTKKKSGALSSKTVGKTVGKTVKNTVSNDAVKSLTKTKKALARKTRNSDLIFSASSTVGDEENIMDKPKKGSLREIVVDGNNCALAYTNNKCFSEKGIELIIQYFTKRGHNVKVFLPQYRRARTYPQLEKWKEDGIVVFTPSRKLGNKTYTPYDDRYIIAYASACQGIVVSQDQFRDLYSESNSFKETIEKRLLVPTFVGNCVMFPKDPLGREGPTLEEFLKHQ